MWCNPRKPHFIRQVHCDESIKRWLLRLQPIWKESGARVYPLVGSLIIKLRKYITIREPNIHLTFINPCKYSTHVKSEAQHPPHGCGVLFWNHIHVLCFAARQWHFFLSAVIFQSIFCSLVYSSIFFV